MARGPRVVGRKQPWGRSDRRSWQKLERQYEADGRASLQLPANPDCDTCAPDCHVPTCHRDGDCCGYHEATT